MELFRFAWVGIWIGIPCKTDDMYNRPRDVLRMDEWMCWLKEGNPQHNTQRTEIGSECVNDRIDRIVEYYPFIAISIKVVSVHYRSGREKWVLSYITYSYTYVNASAAGGAVQKPICYLTECCCCYFRYCSTYYT